MERQISISRSTSQSEFMESTKLRCIFPDEVWLMILGNVAGWKTYQQICKASQHLALLVKEQRTKILFFSVVDILCKNWHAHFQTSQLEVLNWRQICSSWKHSVDASLQCFERHHQPLPNDFIPWYHIPIFFNRLCEVFQNHEDIAKYLDYSQAMCEYNPFLFRKVKICVEWDKDTAKYERFMSSILKLLEKYGKYIWYLCLELQIGDLPKKVKFFKTLDKILFKLTHLKKLKFEYDNLPAWDIHQENRLKAFLSKRPYPLMEKLKSLECRTLPQAVLECLLQQAPNVTDIQMDYSMSSGLNPNRISRLNTFCCSFYKLSDFRSLESSRRAWKITQMELDVSDLDTSWRNIFRVLEAKLSDTLQKLSIRLPVSPVLKIHGGLLLPNLKDLHLELTNFVPLEFLIPMWNTLEELSVEMSEAHLDYPAEEIYKHEETVEFYRYRRFLHRSNIWTIFTCLQNLKCSSYLDAEHDITTSCTRDTWIYSNSIVKID